MRRIIDGAASIAFDDRHAPLFIATWVGAPTTVLIEQAQAWIDQAYVEARAMGWTGVVIISEATRVQLPSLDARRRILGLRHDPALLLEVIAVVPIRNVLVHGLLGAFSRALDRRFALAMSFAQALELAERAFLRRGLAVPESLERLRLEPRE